MVAATNSKLPTLPGGFNYPPPTVPPKAGAPYLESSNLPDNFVFIVVGAVLGFVLFLIIAWRVVMSWSINRAFRRDAKNGAAGGNISYTPLPDLKKNPAMQSGHDMQDLSKLPRSFSNSQNSPNDLLLNIYLPAIIEMLPTLFADRTGIRVFTKLFEMKE
ncbi:hypothetical protein H2204_011152 [Knufia peltigerae]|uniref:Uncharacterized protein n=1 Tax=Knufia peltigerae TaxID=1002370 RepID=A0AA39CS66_9EURO|nr:hypothetical protein H2204_011152 [Knufia peltigerae]